MEIKIPSKGKYQQILFKLHSKVRAKTRELKFPEITEIPSVFESDKEDPDYGQIFETFQRKSLQAVPLHVPLCMLRWKPGMGG